MPVFCVFLICCLVAVSLSAVGDKRQQALTLIGDSFRFETSEPLRAADTLQRAVAQAPGWDYPLVLLASLYQKNYLYSKALALYTQALKMGLTQRGIRFQVYLSLADLYAALGQLSSAATYMDKARRLRPRDNRPLQLMADLARLRRGLDRKKRPVGERIQLLKTVVRSRKGWLHTVESLGDLYQQQKQQAEAVNLYRNTLELLPVKNVALVGDLPSWKRGAFLFVDSTRGEEWTLTMNLPPGKYRYRIVRNYGYRDERSLLDRSNSKIVVNQDGERYNLLRIPKGGGTVKLVHTTLPRDPRFEAIYRKLEALHVPQLAQEYQPRPYYGEDKYGELATFQYNNPRAYAVWLVGSFNKWGRINDRLLSGKYYWPMARSNQAAPWRVAGKLPRGLHQYGYIVNGRTLIRDPDLSALNRIATNRSDIPDAEWKEYIWGRESTKLVGEGIRLTTTSGGDGLYGEDRKNGIPVVFSFRDPAAYTVWVIGSFNEWGGLAVRKQLLPEYYYPMKKLPGKRGDWKIEVKLAPGTYKYQFVVDGNAKAPLFDPFCPEYDKSEAPLYKSIIRVKKGMRQQKIREKLYYGEDMQHGVRITFSHNNPGLNSVWIAGSFNQWAGTAVNNDFNVKYLYPMTGPDKKGLWRFQIWLKPGKYTYKFIENGKTWVQDINAENAVPDGYGKWNSVITVRSNKS